MTSTSRKTCVVIPAYNSGQYIAETLQAIISQTVPPDDIIVIDDGSTDNTAEIAMSLASIVRCFRTKNSGQGCARAFAIEQTDADYIALCDSDDIWRSEHLERRWQLFDKYPDVDFSFSDYYSFGPNADPNHSRLAEAPPGWLERQCVLDNQGFFTLKLPYVAVLNFNPIYPSGMVFRRDSYLKMGGFKPKYSRWIGEDSEFTRRFSSVKGMKFAGDTLQSWGYRRHANNYSLVQWRNIKARADILDEHLNERVVPPEYIESTAMVRDANRCSAFDQAYREKARASLDDLYAQLPHNARNLKRRIKMMLGRAGLFI